MAEQMSRRPYVRGETWRWVLRHPRYLRYMAREFSCLFIGAWTFLLVWGLQRLSEGPQAWAAFLEALRSPASIAFHALTLVFATYHSVTWFKLTPKAMPVRLGEGLVAEGVVSAGYLVVWGVVSLALLVLAGAF